VERRGLILVLVFVLGCAAGDGSDPAPDPADAAPGGGASADAAITPNPLADAGPGGSGSAIGRACTGEGQGNCPAGFVCLGLQGGSGTSWCGIDCAGDATICEAYDGPGRAMCLLNVDSDNDGTGDMTSCVIVCEDTTGSVCPSAECDGTCPANLACSDTGVNWRACL
jgi:hypothetical protein